MLAFHHKYSDFSAIFSELISFFASTAAFFANLACFSKILNTIQQMERNGLKKQPESIAETPAAYIVTMYLAIFRTSGRDIVPPRGA